MIKVPLKNKIYEISMNCAAVVFFVFCGTIFGLDFTFVSLLMLMLAKMR